MKFNYQKRYLFRRLLCRIGIHYWLEDYGGLYCPFCGEWIRP